MPSCSSPYKRRRRGALLLSGTLCFMCVVAVLLFFSKGPDKSTTIAQGQVAALASARQQLSPPRAPKLPATAPSEPAPNAPDAEPPQAPDKVRGEPDPAPAKPAVQPAEPAKKTETLAKASGPAPEGAANPKVQRLIKALDSPSKAERLTAMRELGNLGTAGKAAVPILLERLRLTEKEHADQGDMAGRALAQIGHPALPGLVEALDDPSLLVRARALRALGAMGPDASPALQRICEFLTDKQPALRALAVAALAEMGPQGRPAVPQLVRALRDPDPLIRLLAGTALRQIGIETLGEIRSAAKDDAVAVRLSAVQSLVRYRQSQEAADVLLEALGDPDFRVRAAAAASLAQVGPSGKIAVPKLLECLQENDMELQTWAFTALMLLGSPGDSNLLDALTERNATCGWAWPLGHQTAAERKETIKRLVMALDDPEATRRLGAVLALGKFGPDAKEALPWLVRRLNDPNRSVLAATVLVLPLIDPAQKTEGKTSEMLLAECWSSLKATKKIDVDELIQLYVLSATLCCPRFLEAPLDAKSQNTASAARAWSAKEVDKLQTASAIPALVRGINATAEFNLGFTEPYCRLSFRLRLLAKWMKEVAPLSYAMVHFGEGLANDSPLQWSMQKDALEIVSNPTVLDWMIVAKQQLLMATTLAEWNKMLQRLQMMAGTPGAAGPSGAAAAKTPKAHLINTIMIQGLGPYATWKTTKNAVIAYWWNPNWNLASDSSGKKVLECFGPAESVVPDGRGTGYTHVVEGPFATPPWSIPEHFLQGSVTLNPNLVSGQVIVVIPQYHGFGPAPVPPPSPAGTAGTGIGNVKLVTGLENPKTGVKGTSPAQKNPSAPTGSSSIQTGAPPRETLETLLVRTKLELDILLYLRDQRALVPSQDLILTMEKNSPTQLVAMFRHPNPSLRLIAVSLIAQQRLPVVKELADVLDDPVAEVREVAHQALVRLARGSDFGPFVGEAQTKTANAQARWINWLATQDPAPLAALVAPDATPDQDLPPVLDRKKH
jgi:HEAT repeat protein